MRKQPWLLATVLLALVGSSARAQSAGPALPVQGQLLKTRHATVLLFNKYQGGAFSFQIELDPRAEVKPTPTPGQYSVNGQQLYVKATSSGAYAASSDTATLRRFASSEMHRLLGTMPVPVRPFTRQFIDSPAGRACFVWGYDMPSSLDQSLDGVVYLYFLDGAHLLTLAGTQPKGYPLRQTLDVLFAAVRGYRSAVAPFPAPASK